MRAWVSSSSMAHRAMGFTRVATTVKLQTQWYALRAVGVASSSCRTMFVLSRGLKVWLSSSLARPACRMSGNTPTALESRKTVEFAEESKTACSGVNCGLRQAGLQQLYNK